MASDLVMVAFGYHGEAFHGSQIQPDVKTVQGALIQALRRLTWWSEDCLEMASRTDAGVDVRMNLATIRLPAGLTSTLDPSIISQTLNDHTPEDMVVWRTAFVPQATCCRFAESRTYLYRTEMIPDCPSDVDIEKFAKACAMVEGEHDFSNFCRPVAKRSPIRSISSCQPWLSSDGRVIGFSVTGESFLWNQIRRIASAFNRIVTGDSTLDDFRGALDQPEKRIDLGRAPADGLVLWSIQHSAFGTHSSAPPDASGSTSPPDNRRARIRWLSLTRLENSAMLEREWVNLLNRT